MTTPPRDSMWSVLGLEADERRVYEALLDDPDAGTQRLLAATGLGPDLLGDAVRRLVDLRLARVVDGRFELLEPRRALPALARRRQVLLDEALSVAEDLARGVDAARLRVGADSLYEVLRGHREVVRRHLELVESAGRSIDVVSTPPFLTGRDADTEAAVAAAVARGVRVRVVYDTTALAVPELRQVMEAMAARGEATRVLPRVATRFVVVDGGTTLLPVVGDAVAGPEPRAILVARSALTDVVGALFERYWEAATPLRHGGVGTSTTRTLSAADRALLNLLSNGLPDAVIARELGCSDRTLRRRITYLADLLDASSRFQLGMNALARGWV